MKTLTYPAVLHPEEDGGYSIWLPDVPGCISQGETVAEAMENIKDAFGLYYENAMEGQSVLPQPCSLDRVKLEPGEFTLEMVFSPNAYLENNPSKTFDPA